MSWDDEPMYQRTDKKKDNVVDLSDKRQKLKWSHELMMDKNREPRAALESPLKLWWLKQQQES